MTELFRCDRCLKIHKDKTSAMFCEEKCWLFELERRRELAKIFHIDTSTSNSDDNSTGN